MIVPLALATMLGTCAPNVGPVTMSAVVQYESGWHQNAIGDNTAHHAYFPRTRMEAATLAAQLLAAGHNIDAGLAQVNSSNWATYHVNTWSVFDPCMNLSIGARILTNAYVRAVRAYPAGSVALWHALEAYNTGDLNGHPKYAYDVFQEAFSGSFVPAHVPVSYLSNQPVLPGPPRDFHLRAVRVQGVAQRSLAVRRQVNSEVRLALTGTNAFYFPDQGFTLPPVRTMHKRVTHDRH